MEDEFFSSRVGRCNWIFSSIGGVLRFISLSGVFYFGIVCLEYLVFRFEKILFSYFNKFLGLQELYLTRSNWFSL